MHEKCSGSSLNHKSSQYHMDSSQEMYHVPVDTCSEQPILPHSAFLFLFTGFLKERYSNDSRFRWSHPKLLPRSKLWGGGRIRILDLGSRVSQWTLQILPAGQKEIELLMASCTEGWHKLTFTLTWSTGQLSEEDWLSDHNRLSKDFWGATSI